MFGKTHDHAEKTESSLLPVVTPFFDNDSSTFSYVVSDPSSSSCAIIDSVLNFDYASGKAFFTLADKIVDFIDSQGLTVEWIIETHVHADHLSAAPYLQDKLGGNIAISEEIVTIQNTFGKIFNQGSEFERNGSQFDVLFKDGDTYRIGNIDAVALLTPGHTPACMTHVIGDSAFVGDTLFMPDGGTARADFPGGDARVLYQSIQKILHLPEHIRVFVCHDYCPNGRELAYETTIEKQKQLNIHINQKISEEQFVTLREERDKTLAMPKLIYPSLQVNMLAGRFPDPEDNGLRYLRVPVTYGE